MGKEDQEEKLMEMDADCICHTISGKPIKPKTLGRRLMWMPSGKT